MLGRRCLRVTMRLCRIITGTRLHCVGTVAAPLLAGFCLTATVQALTLTTSDTRWPSLMLLLFMLASLLFVATVQFMFWARRIEGLVARC
jgi:hypothetical protein